MVTADLDAIAMGNGSRKDISGGDAEEACFGGGGEAVGFVDRRVPFEDCEGFGRRRGAALAG